MRVLGCMSGTSHDAVDVAAVDLEVADGELRARLLGFRSTPFPPDASEALLAVLPPARCTAADVCRLDTLLGQAFAAGLAEADAALCGGRAELAVSHGQTVYHWVEDGRVAGTLQLGQPAWIAERTGLPVVSDLRVRDVAAGGQGAPLVSYVDALLLGGSAVPRAALNLGGIANVTVVPGREPAVAFDTGPANMLIDAAVSWVSGGAEAMDRDGTRATRGRVRADLLDALLADPYYRQPPPKTTGRERFDLGYLQRVVAGLRVPVADDDLVATVTAVTARTVAAALAPYGVADLVVSGGGARNPVLMDWLAAALAGVDVYPSDRLGVPVQAKEAVAFAVLGFLSWHGLPATLPSCTGASRPSVLGTFTPGASGRWRAGEAVTGPPQRLLVEG